MGPLNEVALRAPTIAPHEAHRLFRPWLQPGERLLWAGRPRQGLRLSPLDSVMIPFSFAWGGFAIFWMWSAWAMGAPLPFVAFGIPFVLIGFYLMFGRFVHGAWRRARTVYAVSSERLLFLHRRVSPRLESWDLVHLAAPDLVEDGCGRGTIRFEPSGRAADALSGFDTFPRAFVPAAFDGIAEPRRVYDLIRGETERRRRDLAQTS